MEFKVGDRVRVEDTKTLIECVRGELGDVRNVDDPNRVYVELDNGAAAIRGFYSFYPRYLELVAPATPDWEV